ncbi:MAG: hypothetical protein ACT4PT_02705 [Methanobacteriota archaeon]
MKLHRQFNRRVKGKEYSKWLLVIPPEVVGELGWREGDDLYARIAHGELRLGPAKRERRTE